MSLTPQAQQNVGNFFRFIAAFSEGYQHDNFAYAAVRQSGRFVLLQARLFLNATAATVSLGHFESENLVAGQCPLSDLNLSREEVVSHLASGKINVAGKELAFLSNEGGAHGAIYIPFHPDGGQRRLTVLRILGGTADRIQQPDLDWEIKAAPTPYDGLHELMSAFTLGPFQAESTVNAEVIAFNVAAVDTATSTVLGENATVHVLLSKGLAPEKVNLGYRSYRPGSDPVRASIAGSQLDWSEEAVHQRGVASFTVLDGSVVNCTVSYADIAQNHWWLIDPSRLQNSRRAAYETFDSKLEGLRDIISRALRKGEEARDLEAAVSWLLWMLGFSVAQLGGTRRTQDAADLIATTPGGHFAVIECTTGLLKADNKLAILHERSLAVRRSLEASNHNHLRVLPVLITSKSREDIKAELDQAERLGILVLTREDLAEALDRTLRLPAADQIYDEGFQAARAAQAKHEAQQTLPLRANNPVSP
jgi:hypothetical protein